ncbi:MAG: hypothetical protein HRU07_03165 [Nitrosopumilus sp.]|nr:hypothetical protein [Nitrosopumilus sp.]NRA05162.1 hypothetical protein [Nitrosopumilus sp.]
MTKWKKGATEFEMNVIDDRKGSRYVRIPKPLDEKLGNPEKIKFVIKNDKISITGKLNT